LNEEFYHQTIVGTEIEEYISEALGRDLTPVFDQYLRDIRIPTLEYGFRDGKLLYKWGYAVPGFDLPVKVYLDGKETWLEPTTRMQAMDSFASDLEVDIEFYVGSTRLIED
jgi:aminopeptidase N